MAKCWEKILSSKKEAPPRHDDTPNYAVQNPDLDTARSNILGKDLELCTRVTPEEVQNVMDHLSNNKQPGPDRRPNELLKMASGGPHFSPVVASIFSTFINVGVIPEEWHDSCTFLIYKSGDAADPTNYRPIALLNTFNKAFTSVINNRLSKFLEKNNILAEMQGGFRPGRTTFTKIWTLVQTIEHAKHHKHPLHVAYIDLKKAYDSVEHWGLLSVLQRYGFSAQFSKLIMTLCKGNTSQIITPHGLTRKINITRGVRQGCPLLPTLFILFLNPLLQKLETSDLGYKLGDKSLPGGAFADNIVLTTSSYLTIQKQFNFCISFCDHFGLDMAIDGRDKTV